MVRRQPPVADDRVGSVDNLTEDVSFVRNLYLCRFAVEEDRPVLAGEAQEAAVHLLAGRSIMRSEKADLVGCTADLQRGRRRRPQAHEMLGEPALLVVFRAALHDREGMKVFLR